MTSEIGTADPILIAGPSSSGSHLLAVLLDNHPHIVVGPELHLFTSPVILSSWPVAQTALLRGMQLKRNIVHKSLRHTRWWKTCEMATVFPLEGLAAHKHYGLSRRQTLSLVRESECLEGFVAQLAAHFSKWRGKPRAAWAEKSLDNVFTAADLLPRFPGSRAIVTMRHPYPAVASLIRRGTSPVAAMASWTRRAAAALTLLERHPAALLVKYEGLVGDTESTMDRVIAFLGLSPGNASLDPASNGYWSGIRLHQTWQAQPTTGIRKLDAETESRSLGESEKALFATMRLTTKGIRELGIASPTSAMDVAARFGYSVAWDKSVGIPKLDLSTPTIKALSSWEVEISAP